MSDDDITGRYHGGDEYSTKAHDRTKSRKRRDQKRILDLLHLHPKGLTCDEAETLLDMSHQTCSARFSDMKKLGWIVHCGTRQTRTGSPAGVWRTVPPTEGLPLFDAAVTR